MDLGDRAAGLRFLVRDRAGQFTAFHHPGDRHRAVRSARPGGLFACTEPDGRTSPDCPPLTAVIVANDTPHSPDINDYQVVSTAQLSLRVSDVRVNGMALDVGSSCGSGPVTTAGNPLGYDGVVLTGGDVPGDPEPQYATEVPPSSAGRWTARRMSRRFPAAARAGTWTRCSLRRSPVPGTTSS